MDTEGLSADLIEKGGAKPHGYGAVLLVWIKKQATTCRCYVVYMGLLFALGD